MELDERLAHALPHVPATHRKALVHALEHPKEPAPAQALDAD